MRGPSRLLLQPYSRARRWTRARKPCSLTCALLDPFVVLLAFIHVCRLGCTTRVQLCHRGICNVKYLDSFTTSPGPLERQITVAWSSSNFSLPDSDEITLVLHNISGAWKRYTIPYSRKQLNVSGLTVNKEYWFVGNYSVNGLQYAQESTKMWGQSLPSVPTALNSSYTDGKVTLMYSKPLRDGGSNLQSYLLKVNSTDAQGQNSVKIIMLHSSSTTYEATISWQLCRLRNCRKK